MTFRHAAKIGSSVIPPLSDVKVVRISPSYAAPKEEMGRIYRIGYYSRQDGLDRVWLVDDDGDYFGTVDQASIVSNFDVVYRSEEKDLFGSAREPIPSRKQSIS